MLSNITYFIRQKCHWVKVTTSVAEWAKIPHAVVSPVCKAAPLLLGLLAGGPSPVAPAALAPRFTGRPLVAHPAPASMPNFPYNGWGRSAASDVPGTAAIGAPCCSGLGDVGGPPSAVDIMTPALSTPGSFIPSLPALSDVPQSALGTVMPALSIPALSGRAPSIPDNELLTAPLQLQPEAKAETPHQTEAVVAVNVPEPGTMTLIGLGFLATVGSRLLVRRVRQKLTPDQRSTARSMTHNSAG